MKLIGGKSWWGATNSSTPVGGEETITFKLTGIKNTLTAAHANLVDEEAGLLGYEGAHVADFISGIPMIGRAGYESFERRSVWTQAEIAKELNYNTIYGTWSRQGGYNKKLIGVTVARAVARDCAKGGC